MNENSGAKGYDEDLIYQLSQIAVLVKCLNRLNSILHPIDILLYLQFHSLSTILPYMDWLDKLSNQEKEFWICEHIYPLE